jgi:hypothetical protein
MTVLAEAKKRDDLIFWIIVSSLFLIIVILKHVVFYASNGPTIIDELVYKQNAANFFAGLRIWSHPELVLYPPLYSLLLTPAFLFENWYDVMILINGIISTLLFVPVWFIARSFLGRRFSAVAVLLSLMIPFQIIYPSCIMSENLFMPLFASAVLLALGSPVFGKLRAALFGVTLAAAQLTRHLMLPAVFILPVFWIAMAYLTSDKNSGFPKFRKILPNILIMILCYGAIYSLWIFYCTTLDITAMGSMGIGDSFVGLQAMQKNIGAAIMWLSAYGSYIILAAAPFLQPILVWVFVSASKWRQFLPTTQKSAFAWLVLLLTICYWLLATNHSYDDANPPTYILGRYLMFLTPLYIVLGIMVIQKLLYGTIVFKRWHITVSTLSALFAIFMARWILYGAGIWTFPGWFANVEFAHPDAFVYKSVLIFIVASVCTMALGIILWMRKPVNRKTLAIAACTILIIEYAAIFAGAAHRLPRNLDGVHPRYLAPVLSKQITAEGEMPDLYYNVLPGMDEWTMRFALEFWGTIYDQGKLHSLYHSPKVMPSSSNFLMLSPHKYTLPELYSYNAGKNSFYLYKIDEINKILLPEIHRYGPDSIRAGESFNRQPDGSSAMWLKTTNATSWTVVFFNGRELETTVESPLLVTARVPDELFSAPGNVEVYLKERLSRQISNTITIPVIPLYRIDERKKLTLLEIHRYGPDSIRAGESFNRQPDGSSAMWLMTTNATSWTVVFFNGHELETTVESPLLVTARVPDELFSAPGDVKVYLKDRLTGSISEPVVIKVFK